MPLTELSIVALTESLSSPGNYALMLEDPLSRRRLPLIIGLMEAQAIAMVLEHMQPLRPSTHDLFFETLTQTGWQVQQAVITHIHEEILYARLWLRHPEKPLLTLDARPSDAIALCVRAGCPLLAEAAVLEQAGYLPDEKLREKKGSYAEYTLEELEELLARIIQKEDYESAARIRDVIDRRKQHNAE